MLELRDTEGVEEETMHQWRYRQALDVEPVLKPTKRFSNCREILDQLTLKCDGSHLHRRLLGGIAKHTEVYTPQAVRAALHGIRKTLIRIGDIKHDWQSSTPLKWKCLQYLA